MWLNHSVASHILCYDCRTRSTMIAIAVYCVYSFIVIGFDELFSLWAATQAENGELNWFYSWTGLSIRAVTGNICYRKVCLMGLNIKGEFAFCWYKFAMGLKLQMNQNLTPALLNVGRTVSTLKRTEMKFNQNFQSLVSLFQNHIQANPQTT